MGSDPTAQLRALEPGHTPVTDQHIGPGSLEDVPGLVAVGGGHALVAEPFDGLLQDHPLDVAVLGDQDAHNDLFSHTDCSAAHSRSTAALSALTSSDALASVPLRPSISISAHRWPTSIPPMRRLSPFSEWAQSLTAAAS